MADMYVFGLLLLAVIAGFVLGVFQGQSFSHHWWRRFIPAKARKLYFTELSQLLSGQSDTGIETFTRFFKVTPETIDIHFAVGDLLRKRGEVDRATQVHQNIVATVGLSDNQLQRAQLALATDYLAVGLLDRAEILFKPLALEADKDIRIKSLQGLASIFEQEQEWQRAIETIITLCKLLPIEARAPWLHLEAHFYCELADDAPDSEARIKLLERALKAEPYHNRANLSMIRQSRRGSRVRPVLPSLLRVDDRGGALTEYLPDVIEAAFEDEKDAIYEYLEKEQAANPTLNKAFLLAERRLAEAEDAPAVAYLDGQLKFNSHVYRLFATLRAMNPAHLDYQTLKASLAQAYPQTYTCIHCGFLSHQFYWRCPTCKTWH